MSMPIASPSSGGLREQRRADRPSRRAREHAPGARPGPPRRPRPSPPEERITSGSGSRPRPQASREAGQVAAEQWREVGVDDGGREALELAEGREDLVRGGDVQVGQRLAQGGGDPPLVARVAEGEQQADRDRIDLRVPELLRPAAPTSSSVSSSTTSATPIRSAASKRRSSGDQRRRPAATGVVQARPRLAADVEQVGEPLRGDQRGARAFFLEQGVGPDGHPVGETLDVPGPGARAVEHLLRSRRSRRATDRPGCSGPWRSAGDRRRAALHR